MSTSFLPTWLYSDQKIFELELENYSKNYWHPLIFIGEIKPGEILEKKFSGYLIFKNKGYGTKEHFSSLKENGISNLHRKTFLNRLNLI